MNFSGVESTVFFEEESWWKDDIYWLLKIACFEHFRTGKYGLFWDKKLIERWYLLITEKFLFWATKNFLFWTFRRWEIQSFFSQSVDVKILFTWSFWAFCDFPVPGKYGFSCSKKGGFLPLSVGTLAASLLGSALTGQGVTIASKGTNIAGQGF